MKRRGFIAFLVSAPVTRSLPWKAIANALKPLSPRTATRIDATLADIVSACLMAHRAELVANITGHNALLAHLSRK